MGSPINNTINNRRRPDSTDQRVIPDGRLGIGGEALDTGPTDQRHPSTFSSSSSPLASAAFSAPPPRSVKCEIRHEEELTGDRSVQVFCPLSTLIANQRTRTI